MSITGELHWKRLKTGWLITAGLIAVYLAAIQPLQRSRSMSLQKGTGLGAVAEWQSNSLLHQQATSDLSVSREKGLTTRAINGIVGGVPGVIPPNATSVQLAGLASFVPAPAPAGDSADDRRLVRTDRWNSSSETPPTVLRKFASLPKMPVDFS